MSLKRQLFAVSFLILFLELALIRFIPAQVKLVSYFSNFILLGSFLGLGLGTLLAKLPAKFIWFPFLLALTVGLTSLLKVEVDVASVQILFFTFGRGLSLDPAFLLPSIFFLVALVFIPLGQSLGRLLSQSRPLTAYSINLLGSLAGVVFLSLISFLSLPAFTWFLIISLTAIPLLPRSPFPLRSVVFAALLLTPLLAFMLHPQALWSPYYKITTTKNPSGVSLEVNGVHHQLLTHHSLKEPFYYLPYEIFDPPNFSRILIVGSGAGNDTAIALNQNPQVEFIDAVEIDPIIAKLGLTLHPNRPYQNPPVRLHVTDARRFLHTTHSQYDLIIYALPDSITTAAASANIRLESFLFTTESFTEAKNHLTPNGLLVLYNYYRQDWLIDKIAGMLELSFGEPPLVHTYGGEENAAVFFAGPKAQALVGHPDLTTRPQTSLPLATDDWPFLYLKTKTIPYIYLKTLAPVVIISLLAIFLVLKKTTPITSATSPRRFFFFGLGFMLLETKSLATFSLLFGTTWAVNALVFAAILTLALLANILSRRTLKSLTPIYLLLFLSLGLSFFLPPAAFLTLPLLPRYLTASVFYFLPLFCANILFSQNFKFTRHAHSSFGINMLGSLVGGFFEYTSLLTGYRFLTLIIGAAYTLTFYPSRHTQP